MNKSNKTFAYYVMFSIAVITYLIFYLILFMTQDSSLLHTTSIVLGVFILSFFLLVLSYMYRNRFVVVGSILMMGITFSEVMMILILRKDATAYAFVEIGFQLISSISLLLMTTGIFHAYTAIRKQSSILKGSFDQNDALFVEYNIHQETITIEFSEHLMKKYPFKSSMLAYKADTFMKEVLEDGAASMKYITNPVIQEFILSCIFPCLNDDIHILFKVTEIKKDFYRFVGMDVTELLKTEKTLISVNEERAEMLNNLPVGVARMEMIYNAVGEPVNYRYLYANKNYFEYTGLTAEQVIGKLVTDFIPNASMKRIHQYNQVVNSNHKVTFRGNLLDPSKEILITAYGQGNHQFIAIFQDITEITALTKQLEHQLSHDALTQVLNYKGLLETLKDLRLRNAVCFQFDIEHFSVTSDFYGHEIGDKIILSVLKDITDVIVTDAYVARIKHDQFVVYFLDPLEEDIKTYIRKFQSGVVCQYQIGHNNIQVKKNIGYARYPKDASSPFDIISLAGLAMRENAESELIAIVEYKKEFSEKIEKRLLIASKIKKAIDDRVIDVCFQKVLDVNSQEVKYVEALARWQDKDLGRIPPDVFISVARQSNLIEPLEKYLIEKSLMYFQTVNQMPNYQQARLSINLSPRSLLMLTMPDFIESMANQYGFEPSDIIIEISEHTFVHSLTECKSAIDAFKAKGFLIAIDDFGSHYSSLSILGNINYDIIKIDGAFVMNLNHENNKTIVEMICKIAKNSNKEIIAESVETKDAASMLLEMGCYLHQGYYYHKPDKLCD